MQFTKWLFHEGITDKYLATNIERTRVHRKPRILPSQEEILELIKQATEPDSDWDNKLTRFSKMEHRACLSFMVVACGGRNFETSQILREDVSISGLQIELREGKGGSRTQAIPNIPWLIEDLKRRVDGLRSKEELQILKGSHFKPSDKDRLFVVNRTKLEETMRKVGKLWGRPIQVHDLRRIFARDMKGNNASVDDIRDVMGHKSIDTTMRYLEYDTSTQARTLKNYSSEARKYRTKDEKAKELIDHAWEVGRVIKGSNLKGNVLVLEVEIV